MKFEQVHNISWLVSKGKPDDDEIGRMKRTTPTNLRASLKNSFGFGLGRHITPPANPPSFRMINLCLFLASLPVLLFLANSHRPKEKSLKLTFPCWSSAAQFCPNGPPFTPKFSTPSPNPLDPTEDQLEDLNESDVILSVDLLNNWHWCPSALKRMRDLDAPVNEFLAKARRRGSLVIHAVSDSKPHYLNEPGIRRAVRSQADQRVPDGGGRDWSSISKFTLRNFDPPPPTSLSLDRTCGDSGRELFGAQKPKGMNGLNETNLDALYDIVAIDQDVIYSAIKAHRRPIRRILYVGVHLDLCILYSRWFSLLRVAKHWELGDQVHFGIVVPLVDMSNSRPQEHYSTQMERDVKSIESLSCWVSCVAGPSFLGDKKSRIALYDFTPS